MANIVGISGSLRRGSFNTALLRAAAARMPAGSALDVHTVHGIPVYDADVQETSGFPDPVLRLKEAVARADGLILGTPEYNHSVPGVLKNAIDWMSRPAADIPRIFGGRPAALMGASTGRWGTILGQAAWLPVFAILGLRFWSDSRFYLPQAAAAFENGELKDADTAKRLSDFLEGFVRFVRG